MATDTGSGMTRSFTASQDRPIFLRAEICEWEITLKNLLRRAVDGLMSHGFSGVAGLLVSTSVSVADRRVTRARWDGQDWEFKWSGGRLYWDSPLVRPKTITEQNMDLFFASYTPKAGDTVLDVGAGAGTEVGQFSRMVGPTGRVIAIEADPSAARRLRKLVSALPDRNVNVMEIAVGERAGTIDLHIAQVGGIENSTKAMVGTTSISVPCDRLDSLLANLEIDHVSYMKMNIEGAEGDALVGLGSSISKVDEMCVSCHDFTGDPTQATFDRVSDYLLSAGYRVSSPPRDESAVWRNYYVLATKKP